ncbi:hypothetical protein BD309DRAFT_853638 [Dichomitus squalens]|nr:hypothetical protein BD309DRAFT_853638 [Dichomitus squalens]
MDRFPNRTARIWSVWAESRTMQQTAPAEPDSLVEMLMNPDFLPPPLRDDSEVRDHPPSAYNDLPPLEDVPTPHDVPSTSNAPEDHLAPLDDEEPPPLEDDGSSPVARPVPAVDVASTATTSNFPSAPSNGVLSEAGSAHANAGSSRRTSSRPAGGAARHEDDGAESDSSLPSLQSVSDSSDEENDDYINESESDWDDDESLDETEDEASIARMIEDDSPRSLGATVPNAFTDAEPLLTPGLERFPWQSYRDLLERARGMIPDIDDRVQGPPDWVAEMTARITGIDNDPQRAETLLVGMEIVPEALALRYEKLRSTDGEDLDGCAVCRDDLIDKSSDAGEAARLLEVFAFLPFNHEPNHIVAFPCSGKHLFHRNCLFPWLARKTTCPTCRFDIDPHSLTLGTSRGSRDTTSSNSEADIAPPARVWRPPQVESMSDWLDAEERAKNSGLPRKRPEVVMPEYPALPPHTRTGIFARGAAPPRPTRPDGAPLSDILDEAPSWGFDPETGDFDMTAAYEDIQVMRHRFINLEARSRRVGNLIAQLPRPEHNTDVPTRSPSAPAVPPSEAPRRPESQTRPSPSPMFPGLFTAAPHRVGRSLVFGPHGSRAAEVVGAREHDEMALLRQEIASRFLGEEAASSNDILPSPTTAEHAADLRSTPVSHDPPPNDVVIDAPINLDYHSRELLRIYLERRGHHSSTRRQETSTTVIIPPSVTGTHEVTVVPEGVATTVTISVHDSANPVGGAQGVASALPHASAGAGGVPDWSIYNPSDDLD